MTRKPSILFVNQHYWPDVAATGQILSDLAEHLVGKGFDVGVLCSQGAYEGGRVEAPAREIRRGVRVTRLPSLALGRRSHRGRLLEYLVFLAQVAARLATGRRRDLVVLLTTPSMLPVSGWFARRARGRRYAVWSMDVHPEIEVALRILPTWIARAVKPLDRASYRSAEFVVALGPRMKERLVDKRVPESVIRTIPVWSHDVEPDGGGRAGNALARELGIGEEFVVMYSGNAGLAHRFEEVLRAMDRLADEPGMEFVFVGGGPRKAEIVSRVGRNRNFRYLDYRPRRDLADSLTLADVHLLTLRGDMAGLVVPVKLYGIMAAARPVIMVGPRGSESGRTIEEAGIGHIIDPDEEGPAAAERLVDALLALRADPEERRRMGRRAREAFRATFERGVCCAEWERVIREEIER